MLRHKINQKKGEAVTVTIRLHRDLPVWQKAMDLVVMCYRKTEAFPRSELYGLTSQLRRAAASVSSNIAEGKGRRSTRPDHFTGTLM